MLFQKVLRASSKLLSLRKPVVSLGTRKYASKPSRCEAHMNELPIPCGPWIIWYKDQQAFYNKVLIFGATWWVISLALMIYTGSFFLNWYPPAQPSAPSDMIEECEDEDDL